MVDKVLPDVIGRDKMRKVVKEFYAALVLNLMLSLTSIFCQGWWLKWENV